jgi:hypothetical protein
MKNASSSSHHRRIMNRSRIVMLLLLLLLAAPDGFGKLKPKASLKQRMVKAYNAAIYDAAVYKASNVRPLKPLTFDPTTRSATVVTLTGYPYQPGTTTVPVYVWVTQVPEVQQSCQKFTRNLELSLNQLLGLIPGTRLGNFVTMTVTEGSIIRPATNPDPLTQLPCSLPAPANCGQEFPKGLSDTYVNWFASKTLSAWVISEPSQPPVGYPWTRLGYTYNWKPGAGKYGASEYVIVPGSSVTVLEITPYKEYCSRKR